MNPLLAVAITSGVGSMVAYRALRLHGVRGGTLAGYTLGFGPLVGQGLASFQMFYWRLLDWHRPGLIEFLLLSGIASAVGGWASRASEPCEARDRLPRRRAGWLDVICTVAVVLSFVALCEAFVAFAARWPHGGWDAVSLWNVRANWFFLGYERFPSLLLDTVPGGLPQYPLLLPGAVAAQYGWIGSATPVVPQVTAFVNIVGAGILLYTLVSDWGDRAFGAAAVALLWAPQPVWLTAFSQFADVLVAYGVLATFAVLASLLPGAALTRLPAALGGWCLGLLCWTKMEGLPLGAILIGWFALSLLWSVGFRRLPRRTLTSLGLAAIPGTLALWCFKQFWIPTTASDMYLSGDWVVRLTSGERWWQTVGAIMDRAFPRGDDDWWSYIWTVGAVGLVVSVSAGSWWRCPVSRLWSLAVGSIVTFWLVTYAATPFPLEWQLRTSLDRLMVQAYPLAIAGVCGALGVQLLRGYTGLTPRRRTVDGHVRESDTSRRDCDARSFGRPHRARL